jgi:hypothetical protein
MKISFILLVSSVFTVLAPSACDKFANLGRAHERDRRQDRDLKPGTKRTGRFNSRRAKGMKGKESGKGREGEKGRMRMGGGKAMMAKFSKSSTRKSPKSATSMKGKSKGMESSKAPSAAPSSPPST